MSQYLSHLKKSLGLIFCTTLFLGAVHFALAENTSESFDDLEDEIANRKTEIDQINGRLDGYRDQLNEYSQESASLLNDISMIENQIAIAELDVSIAQFEIETQQLELQIVTEQISQQSIKLDSQREMLSEMIFALHRKGDIGIIEVLFGANDFNTLFTEVEQLESLNTDLTSALEATGETKEQLESNQALQTERLDELVESEKELKTAISKLEHQQTAKDTLLLASQDSEVQYRVLMSELRQERQFVVNEISRLQAEVDQRIIEEDNSTGGDPGVMSWPVTGGIITATYHDPTYPFRHLFEHSGLDIAAPTGTTISSAAPGVVAWARTGRSYGNYVMIIHSGGYATLYAHMSRMDVVADQFVSRGQQIGTVGSTGFSTGPHLHFEVRLNGIPVNPQSYLSN